MYAKTDYQGQENSLHYLRTKDGLEVDFALVKQDKIESMIEVKHADGTPSKALLDFYEKYKYPAIQLVKILRHEQQKNEIKILNVEKFLAQLFL